MKIVPNLRYSGQCENAMQLYEKAFRGKICCLLRYSQAISRDYDTKDWPEERLQCIYHGEMEISGQRFMFCDDFDHDTAPGDRIALNAVFHGEEEAKAAFDVMTGAGACVIVAPHATTYSPFMAAVRDPFGIRWALITE